MVNRELSGRRDFDTNIIIMEIPVLSNDGVVWLDVEEEKRKKWGVERDTPNVCDVCQLTRPNRKREKKIRHLYDERTIVTARGEATKQIIVSVGVRKSSGFRFPNLRQKDSSVASADNVWFKKHTPDGKREY